MIKKIHKPIEPNKPYLPIKPEPVIKNYKMNLGTISEETSIQDIIKLCQDNLKKYPNFVSNPDNLDLDKIYIIPSDHYQGDYDYSLSEFGYIGDLQKHPQEIKKELNDYNKSLIKYNKKLQEYNVKLEQYTKNKEEYDKYIKEKELQNKKEQYERLKKEFENK